MMTHETSTQLTVKELLLKEIDQTSDDVLEDLLDFVLFIKMRRTQKKSTAASILKTLERIGKWEGDDLEECLELVHSSRSRIYIPADDENQDSEEG
ncbi:hypothetical protein [Argonema antarcticum]|uniref:hypothetical protein n=1 Tax=Argonema antarcticum TaxID=2942763 RepID=UPI0020112200|nr:hypothetical protein [Argonema antarcticum]MCL1469307.1 hypothetical protein [Argonema antarcticum A004/B2]